MRDDIGNKLVHLTKGASTDHSVHRSEAAVILHSILSEKRLKGGAGFIKGSHKCVCFSEAPIGKLSNLFAENDPKRFKYQPYGIMVDKLWLFKAGGRPVIYGPDNDYATLPHEMKYRHVRFWMCDDYQVDHTWEREWRIKADELLITPNVVTVVVPDRAAKDAFVEAFPKDGWHYIALSDLGVDVDPL